jgi:hypothetical protein
MATERVRRERLSAAWDELVAGRRPDAVDETDGAIAGTLVWFQSHAETPIPDAARERARRVMHREIERAIARRHEEDVMETVAQWQRMPVSIGPNGRHAPRRAGRRRRAGDAVRWAWLQAVTALLLLLTAGFGYLAFRDGEQPAVIPAIQASPIPATPTADWPLYRADPGRTGAVE